jgi:hypothetical protein
MRDRITMLLPVFLWLAITFGYIRCIYKTVTCNWEPIGKAEVIYTIGTFTGTGFIIGYFNIEDK